MCKEGSGRGSNAGGRGETGEANSADNQLGETSRAFVLRRTADVLDNYLPPKRMSARLGSDGSLTDVADEYVVFVAPSKLQLAILDKLLSPTILNAFLQARLQPLGFSKSAELLKDGADRQSIHFAKFVMPLW